MREIGHTKNFILGGLSGDTITKETERGWGARGKISPICSILSLKRLWVTWGQCVGNNQGAKVLGGFFCFLWAFFRAAPAIYGSSQATV